jgi:hypothetical protein
MQALWNVLRAVIVAVIVAEVAEIAVRLSLPIINILALLFS